MATTASARSLATASLSSGRPWVQAGRPWVQAGPSTALHGSGRTKAAQGSLSTATLSPISRRISGACPPSTKPFALSIFAEATPAAHGTRFSIEPTLKSPPTRIPRCGRFIRPSSIGGPQRNRRQSSLLHHLQRICSAIFQTDAPRRPRVSMCLRTRQAEPRFSQPSRRSLIYSNRAKRGAS